MTSRGSWNVEDIEPSVRTRAEAAANRAGMSLRDWLNASLGAPRTGGEQPVSAERPVSASPPQPPGPEVAEIHHRLDSIARQIEAISARPPDREQPPVARQLNEAISRLDERLSRMTSTPPQPAPVEPPPAQAAAPAKAPSALDSAIAEILARQGELDAGRRPSAQDRTAASDMSRLEAQLNTITRQIEALQHPAQVDHAITVFRGELADIRRAITEAMPRQAIEAIEREVRQLAQRIDNDRHNGSDDQALSGVERALGDIQAALRTLTPAEQLAGFDETIRNLSAKLDTIVQADSGSRTIQQLEDAIAALRSIASNVASNEALAQLGEHVQALAHKVDQMARPEERSESFTALEAKIAALTTALENRPQRGAEDRSEQLEDALRALSERLDRMPVGDDPPSAFAHLEQRVSYLLERLEASTDHRGGGLGRVEEGLQDILRHLEHQQANFTALVSQDRLGTAAPDADDSLAQSLRREMSDIRHSQLESSRAMQDSLEAVHNTLGHVVDRLAMIEGDLRTVQATPASASPPAAPQKQNRPELPNPARVQPHPSAPPPAPKPPEVPRADDPPASIKDILSPRARVEASPVPPPREIGETPRISIDPSLPPDHPLEPGTRPTGRGLSPSERIAASESALGAIGPASSADEPVNTSSFIAAARRAAQAAAAVSPASAGKPQRTTSLNASIRAAARNSSLSSRIRSLLVGASVVVIVLGSFKLALTFLGDHSAPTSRPVAQSALPEATSPTAGSALNAPGSAGHPDDLSDDLPEDGAPSNDAPAAAVPPAASTPMGPSAEVPATPHAPAPDVTGSIARPQEQQPATGAAVPALAPIKISPSEQLPDAIGGRTLRDAALKGDPAAAYEVAIRYAEGKGVPANFPEAAKWYERAAQAGVVPAMFRLGTLYEKGVSVKKDIDVARRYYTMAAERGNAKAMHNLAVLEADGGGNGANYRSAAVWFRKAAERGVADSQFNLGILYARGIGVEQNLAESFKWFSLAAAQGDADAARKRDDVAKRLDPQSLAAAKLAVSSFTPLPQPPDAVTVPAPAAGWDAAPAKSAAAKPTRPARSAH